MFAVDFCDRLVEKKGITKLRTASVLVSEPLSMIHVGQVSLWDLLCEGGLGMRVREMPEAIRTDPNKTCRAPSAPSASSGAHLSDLSALVTCSALRAQRYFAEAQTKTLRKLNSPSISPSPVTASQLCGTANP